MLKTGYVLTGFNYQPPELSTRLWRNVYLPGSAQSGPVYMFLFSLATEHNIAISLKTTYKAGRVECVREYLML